MKTVYFIPAAIVFCAIHFCIIAESQPAHASFLQKTLSNISKKYPNLTKSSRWGNMLFDTKMKKARWILLGAIIALYYFRKKATQKKPFPQNEVPHSANLDYFLQFYYSRRSGGGGGGDTQKHKFFDNQKSVILGLKDDGNGQVYVVRGSADINLQEESSDRRKI